jgi:hypothetical protein
MAAQSLGELGPAHQDGVGTRCDENPVVAGQEVDIGKDAHREYA